MPEISIDAEPRTEFGKGAARRIRRADKVPAVLYGHGEPPVHVSLPGHDLMLALKNPNALLSIDIDGDGQLALAKQVQRDPIRGFIEHADLHAGAPRREGHRRDPRRRRAARRSPTRWSSPRPDRSRVEAEATHLPGSVHVSVEGLDIGSQIHASDLELPEGTTLVTDPEVLVVNIVAAPTADELEAELAEAEAEAGIERDESEIDVDAEPPAAGEDGDAASRRTSPRPPGPSDD